MAAFPPLHKGGFDAAIIQGSAMPLGSLWGPRAAGAARGEEEHGSGRMLPLAAAEYSGRCYDEGSWRAAGAD